MRSCEQHQQIHKSQANTSQSVPNVLSGRIWRADPHSGFVETIGTILQSDDKDLPKFGFTVKDKHLNRNGTVHGGMFLSLLDHAFGMTVVAALGNALETNQLATIQFNAQFMGAAREGDFVETECTILRRTRTLVFLRGECRVGSTIVVAGDSVFKVLRNPAANKHKDAVSCTG